MATDESSWPLIVGDAGHGGDDPGSIQIDGEREAAYNMRLMSAVRDELLAHYECRVILTHENVEAASDLYARGELPNKLGAAFFLSVHHNAGPRAARGAEMYIHTRLRLHNGHITRDYPPGEGELAWLDAAGHHPDGGPNHDAPRSYAMAQVGQPIIQAALAAQGIPWHGAPIQCADFAVLRYPNCPCWLIETHFGTNQQDDDIADRPEFVTAVAHGIAQAVAAAMGLTAKPTEWTLPTVKVILLNGSELWGEVANNTTMATLPGESEPVAVRQRARSVGADIEWTPAPPTARVIVPERS